MRKFLAFIFITILTLTPSFFSAQADTNLDSVHVNQVVNTGTPPPTSGGTTSGSQANPLRISNVRVSINSNFANVEWVTNINTVSKVAWGGSRDYRDGQSLSQQLTKNHSIVIPNLIEKQNYFFLITATDPSGDERTYSGQFLSLTGPDTIPPQNVSNFIVTPKPNSISLKWKNPTDLDFDLVRVVRSDKFFPLDPTNGKVIYEGNGEYIDDTDIVPGNIYYYTIFSRDDSGNYSSGALNYAMIIWYSESNNLYPDGPVVDLDFVNIPDNEIPDILVSPNDFIFSYNDQTIYLSGRNLVIPESAFFKIALPESKFLEDAQFMIASAKDNQGRGTKYFYLFTLNKDTGNYEVQFPQFIPAGKYTITVSIFNSARQVIQNISFSLDVQPSNLLENGIRNIYIPNNFIPIIPLIGIICLLFLYLLGIWIKRWLKKV